MRKFGLATLLLLMLSLAVISWVFLSRGEGSEPRREHLPLENAIIIDGIRMESDQPPLDEEQVDAEGSIIYDDAFDDSTGPAGQSSGETHRTAETKKGANPGIARLKARDPRWHLVKYTIRKSDNLWSVSRRFGVSHGLVIDINGIDNPDMLRVGRTLQVPTKNGLYHTVQRGDTLISIARRYRVSVESIRRQNGLRGSVIMASERLFIPDAEEPVPARQTTRVARRTTGPDAKRVASSRGRSEGGRLGLIWPLSGRITSGFGNRVDPFRGRRAFHCGIDISARQGTRVRAAQEGTVIFSGWKDGYGKTVILRHRGGYITVYAHNSENKVQENDTVSRGDVIALSGNTGAVTGAHLHFELRKYLTPLNPMRFLRR
ncbi:MAG: M23 family metallopeptidase [Spirochaetes bacterium]|nr:M23 family metallopeptidase [Spirochaetota bacterium]